MPLLLNDRNSTAGVCKDLEDQARKALLSEGILVLEVEIYLNV